MDSVDQCMQIGLVQEVVGNGKEAGCTRREGRDMFAAAWLVHVTLSYGKRSVVLVNLRVSEAGNTGKFVLFV